MSEQGRVRAPRAWIEINGANVNIMAFEARLVRGNGQPSTADITIALDDPTCPPPMFWSKGGPISTVLNATCDGKTGTILLGFIDYATVDFGTRTVNANMSDNGLPLADNRSDEKWENKTTSQIVSDLASRVGLTPQVGPGSQAGRTTDGQNFAFNSDLQTFWDVIQELAYQDGYAAFVHGNTLYYVPPDTSLGDTLDIQYKPPDPQNDPAYDEANAIKIVCVHNFDLGQGVQHGVSSFRQWNNTSINTMAGAGGKKTHEREPDLTDAQAHTKAVAGQRLVSTHEYTLQIESPGDVTVNQTGMVSLSGTQSAFDQQYYIYEVVHRMNDEGGYDMDITAHRSAPWDWTNGLFMGSGAEQQQPVQGFDLIPGITSNPEIIGSGLI